MHSKHIKLSTYNLLVYRAKKVEILRDNAEWVKEHMYRGDIEKAKLRLRNSLPDF
jgi:hypothetical protein